MNNFFKNFKIHSILFVIIIPISIVAKISGTAFSPELGMSMVEMVGSFMIVFLCMLGILPVILDFLLKYFNKGSDYFISKFISLIGISVLTSLSFFFFTNEGIKGLDDHKNLKIDHIAAILTTFLFGLFYLLLIFKIYKTKIESKRTLFLYFMIIYVPIIIDGIILALIENLS